MKKILISRCLIGEPCRYDGMAFKEDDERLKGLFSFLEKEKNHYILIPICPEILGGLPTPRKPGEIVDGKVLNIDGEDVTFEYMKGGDLSVEIAKKENIDFAILKERSPSCGSSEIYNGTFSKKLIKGEGVTSRKLRKASFLVFSEEDIDKIYEEIKK